MRYEKEAAQYFPRLSAHRRALHRIPELGNEEFKTHAYLMEQLCSLQPDELGVYAGTGIRAVFRGRGGRVIAFRSDMDALPVEENTGLPFASLHPGKMHACGHDGHMATLLVFAEWLSSIRDTLMDTVVLVFQPAEETTGGADRMVREGVLRDPDAQAVYGMHMQPDIPLGQVAVCPGPIMASTCEIDIHIHGKASHGAAPHFGNDAIAAAGHLIPLLQSMVARRVDPVVPALITIGRIEGGRARNVLCDEVRMQGIVRTFSNAVFDEIDTMIRQNLVGIDASFGTQSELIHGVHYPCTENDPLETQKAVEAMEERFVPAKPRMTAEDFSFYQLAVPGVFFFCGCRDESHQAPLHASDFDFDEHALIYGLATDMALVKHSI